MEHVNFPEYQPGRKAWSADRPDIVALLDSARHAVVEPIYYGSNHTFLVTLEDGAAGASLAVYKPARGEYPLYDFPAGSLFRREVATWLVDAILRWGVVPPTVVTRGRYGEGSLQLFVDAQPSMEVEIDQLRRIALLDVVINNADRKIEHCLPGRDGRLWGIDHGLTFHRDPKLRTVFWHFAGSQLMREERRDLSRLSRTIRNRSAPMAVQLSDCLSNSERRALQDRVDRLLETGRFPDPRYKPVPYRW